MSHFKNELLLASAGTGKTYRLTNQFLNLLLEGVEPERVLATTFTRKAAGEILDRVLERLVDAAESEEGLKELRKGLDKPQLTSQQCRSLLVKLVRSLDTFQVRTIDSFFVHLVRLFALDLELPPNWSISDDREDTALQVEAMQDVIGGADRQEMLELLRDLQKGAASRGVQATLLRRAKELRTIALESVEGAWSVLRSEDACDDATLERALQALATAPMAQTAKGADMANWVKSRDAIIASVEAKRWEEVFRKGLGAEACKAEPSYYKKPLSPELLEALAPIVGRAKTEVLNQLVARNEAVHSLLVRFEESLTARKRDTGLFRFEDLPLALAPRTASAKLFDEREAELWFRLDGRLDHLLLDEFQDTSPVQWRILEPLASEITSQADGERSFFCVGDVKQSIYGFRQAEPRLLANLENMLPGLVPEHMDTSYRSSEVVLDVVNQVFGTLQDNVAFEGDGREPEHAAAQSFARDFQTHLAAKDLPGACYVIEAKQPREGDDKHRALIACAVERVALILEEAPHAEVGLLTRVNKNIPLLIHALRERGIDASGEGGNALTDSEAVLVYISMLQLADHPGNRAAAFHLKTSRFADYIGLAPDADECAVREKARWLRSQLLTRGLGPFTSDLARKAIEDPAWSAWDKTRIAQLADQAHAFEARLSLRASDFIEHLRSNRVEAPGGARVRVMTVHSYKGLEFDAVVLPELDSYLVGQRDSYLVSRPDPAGLIEAVMLSPTKAHLVLSPALEQLYNLATSKAIKDKLCGLYVAMTRAKRRIDLILPWLDPEKDTEGKAPSYSSVLRGALPMNEHDATEAGGVLWSSPLNAAPGAWGADLMVEARPEREPEPDFLLAPTTAPRMARRRSASAEEGGAKVTAADLFASSAGARIGTLVHAAFEACEWIEDFNFEPASLEQHGELAAAAVSLVQRAQDSEEIRNALSRHHCQAPEGCDLSVERELQFSALLDEAGEEPDLWNGAIDRLVLGKRGGKVVWAEVLDYKSDTVSADKLEAKAEHYRPQLEAYARVVAAKTGLPAEQVRLRLAFLSMGRVVDLVS